MKWSLFKNYRALISGGAVVLGLFIMMSYDTRFFVVNPNYVSPLVYSLINVTFVLLVWLAISFVISRFGLFKVLGVFSFLLIGFVAERNLNIAKNPITTPSIILFWIGAAYFALPEFFKKYKIAVFIAYGLVITYFFFDFISTQEYSPEDRRNFADYFLYPIPLFFGLWIFEQWRWLHSLKVEKAKAELSLLKTQINPHFFFNTLNNLYGLVIEKSERAPEVVLKLSDMMRYTIYEGQKDFVLLKDEIDYLETYIELHRIRYQKTVDIAFTRNIEVGLHIAPLLFIILLENAFKHGVEKLNKDAFIHMNMQTTENTLSFVIENNYDSNTPIKNSGIGLENLRRRLHFSYPGKHTLNFEQNDNLFRVILKIELS